MGANGTIGFRGSVDKLEFVRHKMNSFHLSMRRLPPLSALRAFEAAARHGSFKQAANELAVTPTAISHQIRVLENWFAAAGLPWEGREGQLRFSDEGHAIQAALAGQGVALLSLTLLADDLRAGRLVRLRGPAIPGHTYHLVRSAGHAPSPQVEAAQAWLRTEAFATRDATAAWQLR